MERKSNQRPIKVTFQNNMTLIQKILFWPIGISLVIFVLWVGTLPDPHPELGGAAVIIAPPSAINAPQGYGVMISGVMVHRVGPAAIYPPLGINGAVNPNVTQANVQSTICKSGWTATIRPIVSYTNKLKVKQLVALHYADQNPAHYEEDHEISLQLAGSPTSEQNLYPEPYSIFIGTNQGGARTKDIVETALKREICANRMTLVEGQKIIVNDWYKYYLDNFSGKLGTNPNATDPDDN